MTDALILWVALGWVPCYVAAGVGAGFWLWIAVAATVGAWWLATARQEERRR